MMKATSPFALLRRSKAFFFLLLELLPSTPSAFLYENDRVAEYHRRNYTWPPLPSEYSPNTEGWRRLFERRYLQVDMLSAEDNAYSAYVTAVNSGLFCPNYTEFGFGLTRTPSMELWEEVNRYLMDKKFSDNDDDPNKMYFDAPFEEKEDDPVDVSIGTLSNEDSDNRPLFLDVPYDLRMKVLTTFRPLLEAWIGNDIELVPYSAYGLRIYRNTSKMYMHVDETATHVVSAIFHINHDEDSEPWPLVIEDFDGNTNEVHLDPGDVLLYESSKCLHGRPRQFRGKWYTSIFLHYYPIGKNIDKEDDLLDTHYRIPPNWESSMRPSIPVEQLKTLDTAFAEPECIEEWCGLEGSKVLTGPAPTGRGEVLSAYGRIQTLDIKESSTSFSETAEL